MLTGFVKLFGLGQLGGAGLTFIIGCAAVDFLLELFDVACHRGMDIACLSGQLSGVQHLTCFEGFAGIRQFGSGGKGHRAVLGDNDVVLQPRSLTGDTIRSRLVDLAEET